MSIIDSRELERQRRNEENTKNQYITPILNERWGGHENVIMEFYFTDGRIKVYDDDTTSRAKPKKADYFLLFKNNIPLAVVEAKAVDLSAEVGYQQAVEYAEILDVPFAYATNGIDLIERDRLTGQNKTMKMEDFPFPEELWGRYAEVKQLDKDKETIVSVPFYVGRNKKIPRYYQRIAINRTVEAILNGQKRIMLVMATGTGKTFTAFQIIHRFWSTKQKRKILFLADRNFLVDQTMKNDFAPFKDVMYKIENHKLNTEYEIYLSLYHQLMNDDKRYFLDYPEDFFDMIVIDECHRGSADVDSNWHEILEYFKSATHVGLTATPKETDEVSNAEYFGEPVYTYSLKQGIDDGFLAPYRLMIIELDIDKFGYVPEVGTIDLDGNPVEVRRYEQQEFDRKIVVQERREIVADRITEYLKESGDRFQKTIIFCESVDHAGEMKRLLENRNADLVKEDYRYVMKITGDDDEGKAQLENFMDPNSKYPAIVTTSKLLSTGADIQTCKLVVLDKTIGSMTEFKQIIGRGTRVKERYEIDGEEQSKMFFTIMDFRKNYEKFNDPDFDGAPINEPDERGEDEEPNPKNPPTGGPVGPAPRIVRIDGVDVEILNEIVNYIDANGNLVRENISSMAKHNILTNYETKEDFIETWIDTADKYSLTQHLLLDYDFKTRYENQVGLALDWFDVILKVGFDIELTSKEKRIEDSGILQYIESRETDKSRILYKEMLNVYLDNDFNELRNPQIFQLARFTKLGWNTVKVMRKFKGIEKYLVMLKEFQNELYRKEI